MTKSGWMTTMKLLLTQSVLFGFGATHASGDDDIRRFVKRQLQLSVIE